MPARNALGTSTSSKATILIKKNPQVKVSFHFNPTEFGINKTVKWEKKETPNSDVAKTEHVGSDGISINLSNLLFDTYEDDNNKDVRNYTKPLWEACLRDDTTKEPPRVVFSWGTTVWPESVISSISETFILFDSDGTPRRSKVSITLTEAKDPKIQPRQNPTSGGIPGKIWVVQEGDRLDLIAAKFYSKPMKWRDIAEYNNIDNPRNLVPGQRIIIPEV